MFNNLTLKVMSNDELITKTYNVLDAIISDSLSEFELIDMKHYLFRCFQILELSKLLQK